MSSIRKARLDQWSSRAGGGEGEGDKERRGEERRDVPGGRVLERVEHELRVVARGAALHAEVGREHLVRHGHLARQPRQRERVRLLQRSTHEE